MIKVAILAYPNASNLVQSPNMTVQEWNVVIYPADYGYITLKRGDDRIYVHKNYHQLLGAYEKH